MSNAVIFILTIYGCLNAAILYYYFVYKSNQADKEYESKLCQIRCQYALDVGMPEYKCKSRCQYK